MKTSRRTFIIHSAVLATGLQIAEISQAQVPIDLNDPLVKTLAYVPDASKVDKAKFKTYQPGQTCSACQLYQGKAGAATGPCAIFSGKLVSAKGWCTTFTKKPA